jgi:CBS domain-containing protein
MGATLAATIGAPLTSVVFVLELTHDVNVLLPLLLAVTLAYGFAVLTMKRSILTEKISRRGLHLSREYAIDPLEILAVREVMRRDILALPASIAPGDVATKIHTAPNEKFQRLYPVVEGDGRLLGVVTRTDLQTWIQEQAEQHAAQPIGALVRPDPTVAYADEPLRLVVHRMAESGLTRFPVVEDNGDGGQRLIGMISLYDLLKARSHNLEAEHRAERFLPVHLRFPRGASREKAAHRR